MCISMCLTQLMCADMCALRYELFWPTQSEFIRMAARFEAIVVPVSSIGAEDSMHILQDANELRENPFLGRQASKPLACVRRTTACHVP